MTYRLVVKSEQVQGRQINLDVQQQHYLLRVLRLNSGDRFLALDGIGNCWLAEIIGNLANIIKSVDINTELSVSLSLLTALPKASGYEQVVRCCTELGVSNFIPVISDRTVLKPSQNKVNRWRKIAIEAAEQSERQIVPTIFEPVKFTDAIKAHISGQDKYICVARGNIPTIWSCLQNKNQSEPSAKSDIIIATGCEGGWTKTEVATAIALGYQPVSLGDRVLRAVTAPIAVSSLVAAILEKIKYN